MSPRLLCLVGLHRTSTATSVTCHSNLLTLSQFRECSLGTQRPLPICSKPKLGVRTAFKGFIDKITSTKLGTQKIISECAAFAYFIMFCGFGLVAGDCGSNPVIVTPAQACHTLSKLRITEKEILGLTAHPV